jgi:hypothetical protein
VGEDDVRRRIKGPRCVGQWIDESADDSNSG